MKTNKNAVSRSVFAAVSLAASVFCVNAHADIVYSSLAPAVAPPSNVPSYGYEANQLSEVGDHVALAGGARNLQSVTVTLSDFALASSYAALAAAGGYNQALTLNIYRYAAGVAGPLLGSNTMTSFIPFRPAEDRTCPFQDGAYGYRNGAGGCSNGVAFNVTFDFSATSFVLPDDLVFGLAFNTQDYGARPTGVAGPYNSLNFGAPTTGATIGTDINSDATFFRDVDSNGVFIEETGTGRNVVAAQIVAIPEPSSIALLGIAGAGLFLGRRRRAQR